MCPLAGEKFKQQEQSPSNGVCRLGLPCAAVVAGVGLQFHTAGSWKPPSLRSLKDAHATSSETGASDHCDHSWGWVSLPMPDVEYVLAVCWKSLGPARQIKQDPLGWTPPPRRPVCQTAGHRCSKEAYPGSRDRTEEAMSQDWKPGPGLHVPLLLGHCTSLRNLC